MSVFSTEMRRNPYPFYARMRAAAPVHHEANANAWMVFAYDDVKRALFDHESFGSGVAPGGLPSKWLVFLDEPRHGRLRSLVLRAFTPRMIAMLEPRIRELSRELLDAALARGEMDLCADYAVPLPMMVIAEMMGVPPADRPTFRRWSDAVLELALSVEGSAAGGQAASAFAATTEEMRAYLDELLARRRVEPRDDLLTNLARAEVEGERLSPDELLAFFQLLLVAGSETTTNLLGNAVLSFVEHPAELARVRKAPSLVPSAIEEVLRYRSPFQVTFRLAKRDVELRGAHVPRGSRVFAMIGSANRDPAAFADPDRFDVTREPNGHLAFGHGIHFCLGAALSRLEAKIALGDLLARTHSFALASDEPWAPRTAFHVLGPTRLPLRFELAR